MCVSSYMHCLHIYAHKHVNVRTFFPLHFVNHEATYFLSFQWQYACLLHRACVLHKFFPMLRKGMLPVFLGWPRGSSGGTRWSSWLRHRATTRKVASLILLGVTGIFHWQKPGVDSASNRNEYQVYFLGCKGGRGVGLTNLPPSCADCLTIWKRQPPGTLRVCPGVWLWWVVKSLGRRIVSVIGDGFKDCHQPAPRVDFCFLALWHSVLIVTLYLVVFWEPRLHLPTNHSPSVI